MHARVHRNVFLYALIYQELETQLNEQRAMMTAKLADVRRESEASHGSSRQQLERLKQDLSLVRVQK